MPKTTIGYIYDQIVPGIEEKKFFKISKKLDLEIIPFNISKDINQKEFESNVKKCKIFYNDIGESMTVELVKTIEAMGKKVIESSNAFYYPEDKWLFYVKCKKNKIPVPETILLPSNINSIKKELTDFGRWPVVLKRIYGERGEFVDRAQDMKEAVYIINKFWNKSNERKPIIAQEFIDSDSYRVTVIDGEIVQTALKKKHGWKATGCYAQRFWKFKIDSELKKIVDKVIKATKIKICGIDLVKKNGQWLVLEANAEPSFKMFNCEYDLLIRKVLELLKKEANK